MWPLEGRAEDDVFEDLSDADADLDTDLDEYRPSPAADIRPARDPTPTPTLTPTPSASASASASASSSAQPVDDLAPGDAASPTEESSPPPLPPPANPTASENAPANDSGPPLYVRDIVIAPRSIDEVTRTWEARRIGKGDEQAQMGSLEAALETSARNLGVQGGSGGVQLLDVANALTNEASSAFAKDRDDLAYELLAVARWMAPDLARVPAEEARLRYESGHYGAAVDAMAAAGRALWREPASQVLVLMGLLSGGLFSVLLLLLVTATTLLVRSFRYLSFDLHNAMPRGASLWMLQVLVVIIAVLPIVMGVGPIFMSLWWITLVYLYLSRAEKVTVFLLGMIACAAPFAVEAVSNLWSWPGSRLADAYIASYDIGAKASVDRVRMIRPEDRSIREMAVLASKAKREGDLEGAFAAWREIVNADPRSAWAHSNRGVVAALMGKADLAVAEFEAALAESPKFPAATFNLAMLKNRLGALEEANAILDSLASDAPGLLDEFRTHTFRRPDEPVHHNRAFIDAFAPSMPLRDLYRTPQPGAAELEREVASLIYLGLRPTFAALLLAGFLFCWIVVSRLAERLQPSGPCVRCGTPCSARYDVPEAPQGTCTACYHIFLDPHAVVETAMRQRKERQIGRYRRRRLTIALFLSLLPGAGHLFTGGPVFGLLLLAGFSMAGSALALGYGPVPWPQLAASTPLIALTLVAFALLAIVYGVVLLTLGRLSRQ